MSEIDSFLTNKGPFKHWSIFFGSPCSSLPVGSVVYLPSFFVNPDFQLRDLIKKSPEQMIYIHKQLNLYLNTSYESFRNYHFLWTAYNENKNFFIIFCPNDPMLNCSDPYNFKMPKGNRIIKDCQYLKY